MSAGITYRRLQPGDDAILDGTEVFDHPVIPEQLAAFLAEPGHEIVIALDGDEVVGMATGMVLLHPDKPPALFISEVGVNESHHRRGIGRRLVDRLVEIARGRGCQGVWVATEADNDAARALYRSAGARETDGIVVYDWDGAMDD